MFIFHVYCMWNVQTAECEYKVAADDIGNFNLNGFKR